MGLAVHNLYVRAGGQTILENASVTVSSGELVTVMGPSGSGKSTLLRAIAGLINIESGEILINERNVSTVPTHERKVGMLFQDLALFPHLSVAGNIAYGLRMQRVPKGDRAMRVAELLEFVRLPNAADRDVSTLSGGEQQRVALARALAPKPDVLLLDEPFASLDATLKESLVREVGELLRKSGTTTVHVTHDPHESKIIGASSLWRLTSGVLAQAEPVEHRAGPGLEKP